MSNMIPVIDYDRARRIYITPDPLPFSEYSLGTRICFVLILIACFILLLRWHGKRKETSSNVRFQRV